MKVSIIIPTYNGAHKLPNILKAVSEQSYKPDEVIVVVDGSTDNTFEVLDEIQSNMIGMKAIYQINSGRSCVRNRGVKEAKGDLLIFFDDDMRPLVNCVEQHVAFHNAYPDCIMTGGLQEEISSNTPEFIQFKSFLSSKWINELVNQKLLPLTKEKIFITAANFSIPKKIFERLGGFDYRLNDAEDFDLAVRAYEMGVPLYFNQTAFAWHDEVLSCSTYIKRLRQYTIAQKKLRSLKPEIYKNHQKFSINQLSVAKRMFFLFFANRLWIQVIENSKWLKILPRKLRFKVYDYVVTANGVFFPEKVVL